MAACVSPREPRVESAWRRHARERTGSTPTSSTIGRSQQGAVDRYWKVVEAFGCGDQTKDFSLEITAEERREAIELLAGLPRPWLAVNAGARWETKRWPSEQFAQAVQQSLERHGGSAILLGGSSDHATVESIASRVRVPMRNLCGSTSLRSLAATLAECDLLLTNDSGPMHLAAAIGTPTVSIFTCTSPVRAAPFGAPGHVVQTGVDCRASYLKRCDHMSCMADVSVDSVLPILDQSLAACGSSVSNAPASASLSIENHAA